ncbi:MAG: Release factor glutamine methyltransferase, partial [Actinomycetota bacterium]
IDVLGPGGATRTLLNLIPNRHFETIWDLGCGSGAIAIALSNRANKVIATDISQRAIDFSRKSAEANSINNIEFRLGSLFEPVNNEKFDLVVSNPPFVIGDVTNLEHRESPFDADGLTANLLREIPNHLNENGIAIFLTAWLETKNETWEERISEMVPANINAWIGMRELQTPEEYINTWLEDAKLDSTLSSEWKSKLESWNTEHIAFGFVVLQKVMSGLPWQDINDVRDARRLPTGDEVAALITAATAANSLTALEIMESKFTATRSQAWRGNVALDGVLSGIRENLGEGMGFDEAVETLAQSLNLDSEDLRVYGLAGVKTLVAMGLLALNTPRI